MIILFTLWLVSVVITGMVAIREHRIGKASGYKFTWGEVSMASVLTFVPILNLIWVFVILRS